MGSGKRELIEMADGGEEARKKAAATSDEWIKEQLARAPTLSAAQASGLWLLLSSPPGLAPSTGHERRDRPDVA